MSVFNWNAFLENVSFTVSFTSNWCSNFSLTFWCYQFSHDADVSQEFTYSWYILATIGQEKSKAAAIVDTKYSIFLILTIILKSNDINSCLHPMAAITLERCLILENVSPHDLTKTTCNATALIYMILKTLFCARLVTDNKKCVFYKTINWCKQWLSGGE